MDHTLKKNLKRTLCRQLVESDVPGQLSEIPLGGSRRYVTIRYVTIRVTYEPLEKERP